MKINSISQLFPCGKKENDYNLITYSWFWSGKKIIWLSFDIKQQLTAANEHFNGTLASNNAKQVQLSAFAKYFQKTQYYLYWEICEKKMKISITLPLFWISWIMIFIAVLGCKCVNMRPSLMLLIVNSNSFSLFAKYWIKNEAKYNKHNRLSFTRNSYSWFICYAHICFIC